MRSVIKEFHEDMNSVDKTPEDIEWMAISLVNGYRDVDSITLKATKGDEAYTKFMFMFEGLEYDSGYGGQKLYGTVVFKDKTWFTRGEYDGSEWWDYHECPTF